MTIALTRNGSTSLAIVLLWVTLTWNVAEGLIATWAGFAAGSVALVGFGLDSAIEVTAAAVLIWRLRLTAGDERTEARERLAHRVVGATFVVLALYILAEVAYTLALGHEPDSSSSGLLLSIAATSFMPFLGFSKWWNARHLGSPALLAEAKESLICSYLSFTLFLGLAANAAFGWWWADIAAALAMVPWIVKEGLEGLRGEACEDACD